MLHELCCQDISYLNRDPSKVILVDCDPAAVSPNPRNAVLLKPWEGSDQDNSLSDLASFLNGGLVVGAIA